MRILFVTVAAVLSAVAPAHADNGWYVSAFGGGATQLDQSSRGVDIATDAVRNVDVSFKTGFALGGSVGYIFDGLLLGRVRTEIEYAYRQASVRRGRTSETDAQFSSDNSSGSVMANVLLDLNTGLLVKPYLGVGVGVAGIESDTVYRTAGQPEDGGVQFGGDTDFRFAFQLIGGVSVPLPGPFEVFSDVRYYRPTNVAFEGVDRLTGDIVSRANSEFEVIQYQAGVRYKF
ncbi:outer membrane protein [Hankyongella ginsenosidimutans]|nr:outer membrane beta-barrel protein [Hankyongella ginsenosidimutans]